MNWKNLLSQSGAAAFEVITLPGNGLTARYRTEAEARRGGDVLARAGVLHIEVFKSSQGYWAALGNLALA